MPQSGPGGGRELSLWGNHKRDSEEAMMRDAAGKEGSRLWRSPRESVRLIYTVVRDTMEDLASGYDYSLIFRTMNQTAMWPRERKTVDIDTIDS